MATALVVDDDEVILETARLGLERSGWTVATAMDGKQALTALTGELPDIVVMDIVMPNMDGQELLANLRSNPKTSQLPVVALSARHDMDARMLELGADGVMRKPFDPLALSDVLRAYLS